MEPELASDLFDSLGLEALLPATLVAWRPLLAEGMAFFLEHLPEARLGPRHRQRREPVAAGAHCGAGSTRGLTERQARS